MNNPKERKTLFVCPKCTSSDIQFMVWVNPNDREIKAVDCISDEMFDGYCNSCEESIKGYDEGEISIEIKNKTK